MDLRRHLDFLTPQAHEFRTVDQRTHHGSAGLVPDNNHVAVATPDIVLQMMADTAAVTHAAVGDDDRAGVDSIEFHGLLRCTHEMQVRQ